VPDRRTHRGPHPEDAVSFAPPAWPALRQAVDHLSWLLSRGYAEPSALKLVGDRFNLTARQRLAVKRCACTDEALASRRQRQAGPEALPGQPLLMDGYNVLITIEAALAGGIIIEGRDGCYRDMASMHGTFRTVQETVPSIELLGEVLHVHGPSRCVWYLDSPVSNSGRLGAMIHKIAAARQWHWNVEVVADPDPLLAAAPDIIITADSIILDRCRQWFNLAREAIDHSVPDARIVRLGPAG
jgi:hypothetical protein